MSPDRDRIPYRTPPYCTSTSSPLSCLALPVPHFTQHCCATSVSLTPHKSKQRYLKSFNAPHYHYLPSTPTTTTRPASHRPPTASPHLSTFLSPTHTLPPLSLSLPAWHPFHHSSPLPSPFLIHRLAGKPVSFTKETI